MRLRIDSERAAQGLDWVTLGRLSNIGNQIYRIKPPKGLRSAPGTVNLRKERPYAPHNEKLIRIALALKISPESFIPAFSEQIEFTVRRILQCRHLDASAIADDEIRAFAAYLAAAWCNRRRPSHPRKLCQQAMAAAAKKLKLSAPSDGSTANSIRRVAGRVGRILAHLSQEVSP
jgi:hypothetical protein